MDQHIENRKSSLLDQLHFIPLGEKIGKFWSTNQKVIGAHVNPPNWTFWGRLYFGPQGVLAPQIFTRPTSPINCISSRTWSAGRHQVGLCPIFLDCLWTKVHQILTPNVAGVVVDHLLVRFSLRRSIPELFALNVESCQKSRRNLDVFCPPKICWGHPF